MGAHSIHTLIRSTCYLAQMLISFNKCMCFSTPRYCLVCQGLIDTWIFTPCEATCLTKSQPPSTCVIQYMSDKATTPLTCIIQYMSDDVTTPIDMRQVPCVIHNMLKTKGHYKVYLIRGRSYSFKMPENLNKRICIVYL